jgi:thymidylate synthase ThyX
VRTLRHVIEMRSAEGAEEELRSVFDQVARVMLREAPFTSRTSSATPTAVGGVLHKV